MAAFAGTDRAARQKMVALSFRLELGSSSLRRQFETASAFAADEILQHGAIAAVI